MTIERAKLTRDRRDWEQAAQLLDEAARVFDADAAATTLASGGNLTYDIERSLSVQGNSDWSNTPGKLGACGNSFARSVQIARDYGSKANLVCVLVRQSGSRQNSANVRYPKLRSQRGRESVRSPDADVVVVGLGVMGSHTLWRLARRGVSVLGIDQFAPGHSFGSSHGASRIIRTAYAEGADYVPLALEAWRLWGELEEESGRNLLTRTGGLMMAPAGSPSILGPIASANKHHLKFEMLSAHEVTRRFPQHRVDDSHVGFFENAAGVIHAEGGVTAALEAATTHGAQVIVETPVQEIRPNPQRPMIVCGGREIVARHVVVAAGSWTNQLLPQAIPGMRLLRRAVGWFSAREPEDFAPESFPIFMRSDFAGRSVSYGVPTMDGQTAKVGLHFWPGIDEPVDRLVGAHPPDQTDADLLSDVVRATLLGLDDQPVRMVSCIYFMSPDGHFVAGAPPELPGITVLSGFSGHGFKFAPVMGEIAADYATSGRTSWQTSLFRPDRFS